MFKSVFLRQLGQFEFCSVKPRIRVGHLNPVHNPRYCAVIAVLDRLHLPVNAPYLRKFYACSNNLGHQRLHLSGTASLGLAPYIDQIILFTIGLQLTLGTCQILLKFRRLLQQPGIKPARRREARLTIYFDKSKHPLVEDHRCQFWVGSLEIDANKTTTWLHLGTGTSEKSCKYGFSKKVIVPVDRLRSRNTKPIFYPCLPGRRGFARIKLCPFP